MILANITLLLLTPLAALQAANTNTPKLTAVAETDARLQADGKGWRLDKAKVTDPKRPRVLLIGDSILSGYLKRATALLDGKVYVDAWINPYCQSEHLNKLLAEVLEHGPYDVVHFNMGLHGWPEGRIKPGTFEPLTKAYVQVLKAKLPNAKLIWASSTPVTVQGKPTELESDINPIIIDHNRMAAKVMAEMNVPVNDFYTLLVNRRELARGDRFHWTAPAYDLLAGTVVESVLRELEKAKATAPGAALYQGWRHSGSIYILTTPEGANLPASTSEEGFPLLVRLRKDFFSFSQARANGEDIRFSTSAGAPLAYQVEEWDAARGEASIWVRLPTIKGNTQQEIRVYWGRADAASESSGTAVFNESNGYLSVWHMNGPVTDEVGTLGSKDAGTTASVGVVGQARYFAGQQGIFCGDKIAHYPSGAAAHSSEAWFRAEKPNASILAWGNEQAQGKVVMQFRSPPHIAMDCYFSDANVQSKSTLPMSEWLHVVHTYQKGDSRIYVNGVLDGVSKTAAAPLAIKSPARLWIGGWYHNYNFVGDIDEVRISKVTRSADWAKLQYENQKALQTLTGPIVQPGNAFSVSPAQLTVPEGKSATVSAEAGGARKVYWILKSESKKIKRSTRRHPGSRRSYGFSQPHQV